MNIDERMNHIPKSGIITNVYLRRQDDLSKMHGGDVFMQGPRSDELFYKASSDSSGVYYLISDRRKDGIIVAFEGLYDRQDGTERNFLTDNTIQRECYPITEFMLNAKPIFKRCQLLATPDFSRCREIAVKMNNRYPVGESFNLIAEDGQHILVQRVEPKKEERPFKVGRPQKNDTPNEEYIFLPAFYLYNNGKNGIWLEKEDINVKYDKEYELINLTKRACNQFASRLRYIFGNLSKSVEKDF